MGESITSRYSLEYLKTLSPDELNDLVEQYREAIQYKKHNRIHFFKPYPYQHKFMEAGSSFKMRYMRGGNRIGKTLGLSFEMAYHLTGLYPDWWKGERVNQGGQIYAVIGLTLDQLAKTLQKELFGVADAKDKKGMGKGSIPRDCIDFDNLNCDGAVVKTAQIKHVSGVSNTLYMYSATNQDILQGFAARGVWIDEMPPGNSDQVWSQALTRTAINPDGCQGFIILTATPEQGRTSIDTRFENAQEETHPDHSLMYMQQVTWDDAPHMTEEIKRTLLAGMAPFQREMREKGLPILGAGIVFEQSDDDISVSDVFVKDHWLLTAGIDFGRVVDPSVVMINAYDPDNDISYLIHEIYLDQNRSPKAIAEAIQDSPYPNVLCVLPHDGFTRQGEASETIANQLIKYGINVFCTAFNNPGDTRLGINVLSRSSSMHKAEREPGLQAIRFAFDEKKLKVSRFCKHWFEEKRGFYYKEHENKQITTGQDHCMDASRIAYLAFLDNRYTTAFDAKYMNSNSYSSFSGYSF